MNRSRWGRVGIGAGAIAAVVLLILAAQPGIPYEFMEGGELYQVLREPLDSGDWRCYEVPGAYEEVSQRADVELVGRGGRLAFKGEERCFWQFPDRDVWIFRDRVVRSEGETRIENFTEEGLVSVLVQEKFSDSLWRRFKRFFGLD